MTLAEARDLVGAKVVYQAWPGQPLEEGVITSVNDHWVFVRYGADFTSKATSASELAYPARYGDVPHPAWKGPGR
jgi:hypothetical protein